MILGKDAGKAITDVERKAANGATEVVDSFWRTRGAVGRLHNIIRYIRWAPQRREAFAGVKNSKKLAEFDELRLGATSLSPMTHTNAGPMGTPALAAVTAANVMRARINAMGPIQDNSTRWNSLYIMIGREPMIKERIDKLCRSYKPADKADKGLKDDQLSTTHWHKLDRVHDCPKVFEITTLNTEGHRPWFCNWFLMLDFTLHTAGQFKHECVEEAAADETFEYLSDCCEHAWHKVEKYHKLADGTPMVYAAVMLNPTMKGAVV
ncbi:hypothetical protein LTR17_027134 [Elasticomyces elasticus]|nr:hypothetical protein LTR17_027134 [Elasticomyces elasticus]